MNSVEFISSLDRLWELGGLTVEQWFLEANKQLQETKHKFSQHDSEVVEIILIQKKAFLLRNK